MDQKFILMGGVCLALVLLNRCQYELSGNEAVVFDHSENEDMIHNQVR